MAGQSFDLIIVGGGTAGCVLAGRLSEDPAKRILLIEAGGDAAPGHEHPDVRDSLPVSLANPDLLWRDLTAELGPDLGDGRPRASRPFLQGKGVGGSSNIQGMFAMRGLPEDYDEWRESGVPGWGWDDVLPYFNKLERDCDFSGPLHGKNGPIPIRRTPAEKWSPFSKAVGEAIRRRGYTVFADYTADFREGLSAIPMANLPNERVSASMAYLTAEVRRRPNLAIVPHATAERLIVERGPDGVAARGVSVRIGGEMKSFHSAEIIVACGALQSPVLLMRSGIGPGKQLQALGVEVLCDSPGIGRNLQNHPKTQDIAVYLPPGARQPLSQRTLGQNCLRYSSGVVGCAPKDMFVTTLNKTGWHALGRHIGLIGAMIHRPYSTGSVELASADPSTGARIKFNVLSDTRDAERLVGSLRFILTLLQEPDVKARRREAFLPQSPIAARFARPGPGAAMQASALALLLEIGPLRRNLMESMILDIPGLLASDRALEDFALAGVELSRHPAGTCKMGPEGDRDAVLDPACHVRGVAGLRVVDASIFPTLMRGNTHIPVIMAAEKVADHVRGEWRRGRG